MHFMTGVRIPYTRLNVGYGNPYIRGLAAGLSMGPGSHIHVRSGFNGEDVSTRTYSGFPDNWRSRTNSDNRVRTRVGP